MDTDLYYYPTYYLIFPSIIMPIISSVDTERIGKYIGNKLYIVSSNKGILQVDIAKKLGVRQGNISAYLTGKVTTKNINQYWRIAQAIPITRKEFDKIVEEAKRKVLGTGGDTINDEIAIAHLLGPAGNIEKAREEVSGFIQFIRSRYK